MYGDVIRSPMSLKIPWLNVGLIIMHFRCLCHNYDVFEFQKYISLCLIYTREKVPRFNQQAKQPVSLKGSLLATSRKKSCLKFLSTMKADEISDL